MIYGKKSTFAIEYEMLYGEHYPDDWGWVRFWVNNRNLFAFKDNKPGETYQWYVYMFASWLCDNLAGIMEEDDFTYPVEASSGIELHDKIDEIIDTFDEDSQEKYDWGCERYYWNERHCFYISRGGSFAPEMWIRAYKNKIEFNWDTSTTYETENVYFLYPEGLEYVSRADFFTACVAFLNSYCNLPKTKDLKSIKELKLTLQKTIETVII